MHIRLTDYLICPRCESELGLILLAERVENQRVHSGQLGCPSCRTQFRVDDGIADFSEAESIAEDDTDHEDALALAALLGVTEGPAMLALIGEWRATPAQLAAVIADVEVIVLQASRTQVAGESNVSRLRAGHRLPLRAAAVQGVVVGGAAAAWLSEAARICRLAARVVLLDADVAPQQLAEHGLRVLAQQGRTMVAVRER
jgi:uncharacterized protein YbaR (Trm112 family)